jgi:predicted nucleic acid-binding protein
MWVFDATPLIYLAKADRLGLAANLDGDCRVPQPVYEEVVTTGLEEGYPDARRIERCTDAGVFDIVSVPETGLRGRLKQNPSLSEADIAVLTCADAFDATAVMDEAAGRTAAEVEGIETRGTAYLVLLCAKRGRVSVADARETIDSMIDDGWHCAPDLYARIVRKLESLEKVDER